jgi:hypothetical protein
MKQRTYKSLIEDLKDGESFTINFQWERRSGEPSFSLRPKWWLRWFVFPFLKSYIEIVGGNCFVVYKKFRGKRYHIKTTYTHIIFEK